MTRRFAIWCDCPTYEGNAGVCATFEAGGNARCVYCDHRKECHDLEHDPLVLAKLEKLHQPDSHLGATEKI